MVGAEFNILFGLVDIVDWIYENFHKKPEINRVTAIHVRL